MKTIEFNGKQLKTNLGEVYSVDHGNGRKTMRMAAKRTDETEREFFERLAKWATKNVTFFRVTTYVPGYYNVIAYYK